MNRLLYLLPLLVLPLPTGAEPAVGFGLAVLYTGNRMDSSFGLQLRPPKLVHSGAGSNNLDPRRPDRPFPPHHHMINLPDSAVFSGGGLFLTQTAANTARDGQPIPAQTGITSGPFYFGPDIDWGHAPQTNAPDIPTPAPVKE
ncbi:hypothetical protein XMM379_000163 [Aliiroseovarius sp. xm-m-379]|uniref:hypothetical protein n=1 Tax=unclassified Aliiroseovarius TaxID=2623558 RepID=UPI001569714A|nr:MULTISPECIES: hypothetical protein [unclassified Aliiroseovarius]NRP14008.1 hypothetical protein [Aliiroseovarius sp. xm-d-517]NRP23492.1 hypothetical protein [Aliiroseovarius sp. xm-m-379]NRP32291.1 hypothetical protein [Aliiroseovarius sp. xm-a-104]NRP40824.1 hypothetical protein [Aliiroseovarius sp. xm-m-339-2]NRP43986.1 hypothetical protein [Aliiroseovarius sp. xm-m-378]